MSTSFSLAKRRTVAVLYLVNSLAWNYAASLGASVPSKSRGCLKRLLEYKRGIMMHVVHVSRIDQMGETRRKQYEKILADIERVIDRHKKDGGIDGDVFTNAILACVEDVRSEIPSKNKRLAVAWDKVTDTMVTLYRHRDPDFSKPEQAAGVKLAEDLMLAIEGKLPWNYGLKMLLPKIEAIQARIVA